MKRTINFRTSYQFLADDSGPTATEYAVMLAFMLTVIVASLSVFGDGLATKLAAVSAACFG